MLGACDLGGIQTAHASRVAGTNNLTVVFCSAWSWHHESNEIGLNVCEYFKSRLRYAAKGI